MLVGICFVVVMLIHSAVTTQAPLPHVENRRVRHESILSRSKSRTEIIHSNDSLEGHSCRVSLAKWIAFNDQ